jgi:cell fate regulator YaaT (PSP1 superfamily)
VEARLRRSVDSGEAMTKPHDGDKIPYLPRSYGAPERKPHAAERREKPASTCPCRPCVIDPESDHDEMDDENGVPAELTEELIALEAGECDASTGESGEWKTVAPETDRTAPKVRVPIVGVRFNYAGKVYHFDGDDLDLSVGDRVVVKTEKGLGLGRVALAPRPMDIDPALLDGLRKVLRKAVREDFEQQERCVRKERIAALYCEERIAALNLPMKLVGVECFFDCTKYVFYFTAEGRVDFRELVKQLVQRFPVRIEMRQIGVRHEAKMIGGLATCGQELCCARFLNDFRPVSVKMAKTQNLSLNPGKISGVCGRLMCCLAYEHEIYERFRKTVPKVGRTVMTPKGPGMVVKLNPLNESVQVRLDESTVVEIPRKDLL